MHIATLTKPVTFAKAPLHPGRYVLDDMAAGNLLLAEPDSVRLDFVNIPSQVMCPQAGETMTVIHSGGFGDLLWLNSVYERLPAGAQIEHACYPFYAAVLNGFVACVRPYPILLHGFGPGITLERVVSHPPCVGEHPADRFSRAFGLPPGKKKAEYRVTQEEQAWAEALWPRTGKRRVAVQAESSVRIKNYPHLSELIWLLHKAGLELVIVGAPMQGNPAQVPPGILDCRLLGHSVRESFALAGRCDACVGADSVLIHLAHALDIPALGLFGAFDGRTYMQGYEGRYLQGRRACSPCHLQWPQGRPAHCVEDCTALGDIPAAQVVSELLERVLR